MPDHPVMRGPADIAPVLAILRGIEPREAVAIGGALIDAGIRAIEVPLNSPEPLESVRLLCRTCGESCAVGAGTVLTVDQVDAVHAAGGRLIVSPNTNVEVIGRARALGLTAMPGFATATEAFTALAAGARYLKLFPAATYGPDHLRALRAVLPADARVYAVGGVGPQEIPAWRAAGVDGIGVGGEVFRPGRSIEDIARRARLVLEAFGRA